MDLPALIQECVPVAYQERMARIVAVESSRNPYAIGVVGGRLERQPKTAGEAVATQRHCTRRVGIFRWAAPEGYQIQPGTLQTRPYQVFLMDAATSQQGLRSLRNAISAPLVFTQTVAAHKTQRTAATTPAIFRVVSSQINRAGPVTSSALPPHVSKRT